MNADMSEVEQPVAETTADSSLPEELSRLYADKSDNGFTPVTVYEQRRQTHRSSFFRC